MSIFLKSFRRLVSRRFERSMWVFAWSMPVFAVVGIVTFALAQPQQLIVSDEIVVEYNLQNLPVLQSYVSHDEPEFQGGLQDLVIEGSALVANVGMVGTTTKIEDVPQKDQSGYYIVREGDTASGIAALFTITTETLLVANDLTSKSVLKIGQELYVPPTDGVAYTVAKGDTPGGIAAKFDVEIEAIMDFNLIYDETTGLRAGEEIFIPGASLRKARQIAAAKQKTSSSSSSSRSSSTSSSSSGRVSTTHDALYNSSYYVHPTNRKGTVSRGSHGRWKAYDIAAKTGTPIVAAASGKVIRAAAGGWNGGYGSVVVIQHDNGTKTLYAHMSKVHVYQGQNVVQGQVIGLVGNTGRSTGPHLHYELRTR